MEPAAWVAPDHFRDTSASRRAVVSWAIDDLGNTIFSLAILSLHFPSGSSTTEAAPTPTSPSPSASRKLLMFLAAAVLGTLSDQTPRRTPLLAVTTLICVAFTALLGTGGFWLSLGLFVAANFACQAGSLFCDTLLHSVAPARTLAG